MPQNLAQISIAIFALIALMFLQGFGILGPVVDTGRLAVNFIVRPPVFVLEKIRDFGLAFFAVHGLVKQNEILRSQVQTLSAEVADLEQSREENKTLREALGFQGQSRLQMIPAEVISYDYLNFDQKAVLNRGSDAGLVVGDNVVVSGGILVGMLTEVSAKTSEMELITSSNMVVNARTTDGSATGVVRGEHGLGLLFDQVSQTEVLKKDDKVVTSGLGGRFLNGLFVGTITDIKSGASELFQTASLIPAADFRNLEIIFIIKR